MLNDINVKFVIFHGNLIEITRGNSIYHDDDLDLVSSKVKINNNNPKNIWTEYDINFNIVRKIIFLGIETTAPSNDDTMYILKKQYGDKFLTNYKN